MENEEEEMGWREGEEEEKDFVSRNKKAKKQMDGGRFR